MKRSAAGLIALTLAACAANPAMEAPRQVNVPPPPAPVAQVSGSLLGATMATLLTRFGEPAQRVTEGDGQMLQFRAPSCILDAYSYTSGGERVVTHVDARDPNGNEVNREACIAAIEAAR